MEKHFCVSCYVLDEENKKFLMVKHKKLGKWVQPGGHIELNEDPEEACKREVWEETGIDIELMGKRFMREEDYITPLALQCNKINDEHIHMDFVYAARVLNNKAIKINLNESDAIGWFSIEEILDKEFETYEDVRQWCEYILKRACTNSF